MSGISIDKLRPHPSNNLYFDDLAGEDWDAFLNDVRENGIRDPLRITTDFQVICGHQRLRAAKELGFQTVPVIIEDIQDVQDVERLLVEDNLHRRHLTPIQKAKLAATLKERWGLKSGRPDKSRQNGGIKTTADIAEAIGETQRTTERLIKLNDLVPELKKLVESKKLGTTFAEKLAALTPEEQTQLHRSFGEEIGKTAKKEAERFIQESVEYEKTQIEKKYRDSVPKDLIPDIEAAAIERHQEETTELLRKKEEERDLLLKRLEADWKKRLKDEQEKHQHEKEQLKTGYQNAKQEIDALKLQIPSDSDSFASEQQLKKLQREGDINTAQLRIVFKSFVEKGAVTPYLQGAIANSSESERDRLKELVDAAEQIIEHTKIALTGRRVGEIS